MLFVLGVLAAVVLVFFIVRWQGQHHPRPMPYWLEGLFLDNPLRRWMFGSRFVLDLAEVAEGERVGEVGSGIGYVSAAIAERVGAGGSVQALDQSARAVRATDRRLLAYKAAHGVARGDATALPWPSGSLDAVVMVAMLGEIPAERRVQALSEVQRVLRPGGRLVVVEYWPDPHFLSQEVLARYLTAARFRVEASRQRFGQYGFRARPHGHGCREGGSGPGLGGPGSLTVYDRVRQLDHADRLTVGC